MMTTEYRKLSRRWSRPVSKAADPDFEAHWVSEEVAEAYPPHPGRRMTEEEFLEWVRERTRAEWVNGEVIIMSPVSYDHDHLQTWLLRLISDFVDDRDLGDVCSTEFWLRLPNVPSRHLTDLFFVARGRESGFERVSKTKVGPATCFNGPPDLIVEIVSPDSVQRDRDQKFDEYQGAGVREYWIVDPLLTKLDAYELAKGKFRRLPEKGGAVHSKVLKGFFVRPAWLWETPRPKKSAALREMNDA